MARRRHGQDSHESQVQHLLDSVEVKDGLIPQNDNTLLNLLRYLSKKFQVLPPSLVIQDVQREGTNPVAGGGFADIWRGTVKEKPVCLKVLRLILEQDEKAREKIRNQFYHEALVWRQLRHPNILPLLGVNSDLFSPSFGLISPWMENKDIITYLKEHQNHDISPVLSDISAGLHYLHSRNPPIVHGDIRGGNILVTNDLRCCLADFGLAVINTESQAWTVATSTSATKGTIRWMAPEYIFSRGPKAPHTSRDIYAFGCTIFEIITRKVPFYDCTTDPAVLFSLINRERPSRPRDVWCPDMVWSLADRCWEQDSSNRPSAQEIHTILHPSKYPNDAESIHEVAVSNVFEQEQPDPSSHSNDNTYPSVQSNMTFGYQADLSNFGSFFGAAPLPDSPFPHVMSLFNLVYSEYTANLAEEYLDEEIL
ncbi:kinase-like domain-containing protein [Rhodocollybia butyracea]|uniref:Kinase-like domain-containing protein n=1 Tax=Rhodocollybia butyracea TaxID=206335 RepID=A0A9P5PX97_9AGAR|nr:kinase-like domain-containing protein [Rhodocollybia butyracea]